MSIEGQDDSAGDAEARVRELGVITLAQLSKELPSRDAANALVAELVKRGLEKTAKVVRVPLREQLTNLVRSEAEVPLTGLHQRLAGATAAEAKRAASALSKEGAIALVLRGKSESLVWAEGRVADADEVRRAAASVAALKKLVQELDKSVSAKAKHAVLRADLASWCERVCAAVADVSAPLPVKEVAPVAQAPAPAPNGAAEQVFSTLAKFDRDPLLNLVYLPDLMRALGRAGLGVAVVHEVLLEAAERGELDMKPESDPDRLSSSDRSLCVVAPSGRLISYLRVP